MNPNISDTKLKKVLITTSTFPLHRLDTQPRFIYYLAKHLSNFGENLVLAPRGGNAKLEEDFEGVKVKRYRYFFSRLERLAYGKGILENLKSARIKFLLVPFLLVAQFFSIILLVRRHKIRTINAHWVIPQGVIAILVKCLYRDKLNVVITSHGSDLFSLNNGILNGVKRWVLNRSDAVIVVSNAMKDYCINELGISNNENIFVRSMGVDLKSEFVTRRKQRDRAGLIFVGRLIRIKGLATLLEAMSILKSKGIEISLNVVGSGPQLKDLLLQASKLGIEDSVSFSGAVTNNQIPDLLNEHKIFILPSVNEGLGLVAVEAMGCGCAVIASELDTIQDLVVDGTTGLLFKVGDADDLARKIKRLLENQDELEKLAMQGREFAIENFDWQRVASEYAKILSDINKSDFKNV